MAVVALDTHAVVKELQAAGFTEPQAEALTRLLRQARHIDLPPAVARAGDEALRQCHRRQMAERKAAVMQKVLVGAMILQAVVLLGAPFVLIPLLPR